MPSKYTDFRYTLNEVIRDLPTRYFTTYEVGYLNDSEKDINLYGVYEKGTNNAICQTGQSQGMARLLTELLNNIDLVDSSLRLIGKLDEQYDLQIEMDGESLPLYDKPKQVNSNDSEA